MLNDLPASTLLLILLGIIFMLAELGLPSCGALAFGGLIFLLAGFALLYAADSPLLQQASPVLLAFIIVYLLFLLLVIVMAIKARQRKQVSGREALLDQIAIVTTDFVNHEGWIRIEGELWQARAEEPLKAGDQVQIIKINGLKLFVKPL